MKLVLAIILCIGLYTASANPSPEEIEETFQNIIKISRSSDSPAARVVYGSTLDSRLSAIRSNEDFKKNCVAEFNEIFGSIENVNRNDEEMREAVYSFLQNQITEWVKETFKKLITMAEKMETIEKKKAKESEKANALQKKSEKAKKSEKLDWVNDSRKALESADDAFKLERIAEMEEAYPGNWEKYGEEMWGPVLIFLKAHFSILVEVQFVKLIEMAKKGYWAKDWQDWDGLKTKDEDSKLSAINAFIEMRENQITTWNPKNSYECNDAYTTLHTMYFSFSGGFVVPRNELYTSQQGPKRWKNDGSSGSR